MSNWIRCSNGMMLNMDNVLTLKINRTTATIIAECVGGRTVDVENCKDKKEAEARINEILNTLPEAEEAEVPVDPVSESASVEKPAPRGKSKK